MSAPPRPTTTLAWTELIEPLSVQGKVLPSGFPVEFIPSKHVACRCGGKLGRCWCWLMPLVSHKEPPSRAPIDAIVWCCPLSCWLTVLEVGTSCSSVRDDGMPQARIQESRFSHSLLLIRDPKFQSMFGSLPNSLLFI